MSRGRAKKRLPRQDTDIVVVGATPHPLRDLYHKLLTVSWPRAIAAISVAFLAINAIFASAYVIAGGVAGGEVSGGQGISFAEAFFFSAQTLGTIGYGAIHPTGMAANAIVVVESLVSVLFTAIATGIIFARFSRSSETLIFCEHPCISLMDGVPTLTLRVGNDREGAVMDAQVRLTYVFTQRTREGVVMYRMKDLPLARERTPSLGRTWTVLHAIDESSPLFKATPRSCDLEEVELIVSVVGTDGTSLQPVHAGRRYLASDILWGERLGDVLSELPDGRLQLDCRKFHDTVKGTPTPEFPYPAET